MTKTSLAFVALAVFGVPALAQEKAAHPVKAATQGPKHHFFGYYDVTPWDKTGRFLLANEIGFVGRQPKEGEALTVGMVDLKGDKYMPFDTTLAWCWQMGTRLQWLGSAPEREVVYNSVEGGKYVCVIRDVLSGKVRKLPRPIYALSPDGTKAVTLDFDRLHRTRPGYGYLALPEKHADDPAPKDMGIYLMDMKTGASKLIVSLAWAAGNQPDERFTLKAHHWFNHLLFSPTGSYFIFLHRWQKTGGGWWTRMYVGKADWQSAPPEPKLVFDDGMVSHFDWRDDFTILAWARTKEKGDRFYLVDWRSGEKQIVGDGVLTRDGHCSFAPDRKWILNDTYPDADRLQTLMLFRPRDGKRFELGKFFLPRELAGPARCDLHPRWHPSGSHACFDSAHEGSRQIYVVDCSALTN